MRALRSSITVRIASLRQPPAAARLARGLWIIWAIIVWNVVFDQVIVRAGRDYLHAAGRATATRALRPNMDAYMRPAAQRGVWIATAAGALILCTGLASLRAARRRTHDGRQVTSCA